ncbi:MAG: TrkA C-terminal domain-containing protein [Halobacteriota archaeon]
MARTALWSVLQTIDPGVTPDPTELVVFAIVALVVSAASALLYRWYTREQSPLGPVILVGVATVAVYLNTVGLFGDLLTEESATVFQLETVVFNLVSLGVATAAAVSGRGLGDRIATDIFAVAGVRELDTEVSRIVKTVGRVTSVDLPDEIGDIDGYDPVAAETKAAIGGKTFLFPRRLTVAELHDRLANRLKDDYGVGHVDLEVDDAGRVEYLALGSRAAGIGPTLAPGTVAVALQADPAAGASPGDVVQVWATEPRPTREFTAELRATVGDVVTLSVDATDASTVDAGETYRIVTLPNDPRIDRDFASLLRVSDETMGVVTVGVDGPLVGETVGDLDVTVTAVRDESGAVEAIPRRARTLSAGDVLYVVARPEALRRLGVTGTEETTYSSAR